MVLLYKVAGLTHSRFVFENEDDRDLFVKRNIIPHYKARAVEGCGVDIQKYSPQNSEVFYSDTTVFTFIGRLLYDKGILEFIKAAEEVEKSSL